MTSKDFLPRTYVPTLPIIYRNFDIPLRHPRHVIRLFHLSPHLPFSVLPELVVCRLIASQTKQNSPAHVARASEPSGQLHHLPLFRTTLSITWQLLSILPGRIQHPHIALSHFLQLDRNRNEPFFLKSRQNWRQGPIEVLGVSSVFIL